LHGSATIASDGTVRLVYDALDMATGIRKVALTPAGAAAGPPQSLMEGYGNTGSPSLSADGGKLAFATRQPNRLFLRIVDVASGQIATVATIPTGRYARPILSGDGSMLAYWSANKGYLISSKGGVPDAVCSHCGPPTDLNFDGSSALFESGDTTNQLLLCARHAEPRPIARVVDAPSMYISAGRWSPDHRWILFCGTRNARKSLYLVPVTSDGTAKVSQLVPVSDGQYDAWEPAWSPDGKHVYFVAKADRFWLHLGPRHRARRRPAQRRCLSHRPLSSGARNGARGLRLYGRDRALLLA
jgi:dipeptidyl aminopeptidase/acylaminoacyl peptidase